MSHDPAELDELGVLRIRGPDAVRFLQGQLSNDLERLQRERSLLAGLHNPQGRTIALLRLLRAGEHEILALLPRDLIGAVAQRLGRFILRAKVQLADESAAWRVRGFIQPDAPSDPAFKEPGEPVRWIGLAPGEPAGPRTGDEPRRRAGHQAWRLLDIAAGLPQVYPRTSELFVAQMLNLDAIDAISFSKGCYTGQEVVARAHYRGRVKRRMQRWRTASAAALAPGDAARLTDGRMLRVVDAAVLPDGRCEFLAVAPLAPLDPATAAAGEGEDSAETGGTLLAAEPLPLPYALPT